MSIFQWRSLLICAVLMVIHSNAKGFYHQYEFINEIEDLKTLIRLKRSINNQTIPVYDGSGESISQIYNQRKCFNR